MTRTTIIAAMLVLVPVVSGAMGIYTCEPVNRDSWMTGRELTAKLEEEGWRVRFMKEDGVAGKSMAPILKAAGSKDTSI